MKVVQHPNYYEMLLMRDAKVVEPLKMKAEVERGKGRMWTATAKLAIKGFEFHLHAYFFGGLAETENVAAANLNLNRVVMSVEGGETTDKREYNRVGHALLMLEDGIYIQPDKTKKQRAVARNLCDYDSSQYMGMPTAEEYKRLEEAGYKRIMTWTR